MTPLQFLILMIAMTVLAASWQFVYRRRQVLALRALAEELQMHYSIDDRFRLAPRIASRLAVPGAAAVTVSDLFFAVENENYRYIFRVEYTLGVLRSKVSVQRVATFSESRDRSSRVSDINLQYARHELPLIEQYRQLHAQTRAAGHVEMGAKEDVATEGVVSVQ